MQEVARFDEIDAVRGQHDVPALRQPLPVLVVRVIFFHEAGDGMRRAAHTVLADDGRSGGLAALGHQQVGKGTHFRQRPKRDRVHGVVGTLRYDVHLRLKRHALLSGRPNAEHFTPPLAIRGN